MNISKKILIISICFMLSSCASKDFVVGEGGVHNMDGYLRSYFIENPDVLQSALNNLARIQAAQEQDRVAQMLASNQTAIQDRSAGALMGDVGAKRSIVLFSDYNCHFCKSTSPYLMGLPQVKNGQVSVIVRELPVLSPASKDVARYALAAAKLGKYEAFHVAMMKAPKADAALARATMGELGLSPGRVDEALASKSIEEELTQTLALAKRLGINATPVLVIDGVLVNGWKPAEIESLISGTKE